MFNSIVRPAALMVAVCLIGAGNCDTKKEDMADGGGGVTPGGTVATGGTCGTIAGLVCASASDYCAMPAGSCRIADNAGTCTVKPQVIPAIFDPVCGCDSMTYSNDSAAAAAGINVLSQGSCPSPL